MTCNTQAWFTDRAASTFDLKLLHSCVTILFETYCGFFAPLSFPGYVGTLSIPGYVGTLSFPG
jgi:hypothetical protein